MQKDVSTQSILRTMLSIIYKTMLVWTQQKRNNIMSDIFGDDGLVSANDTFNFEAK
jgi:hypothetical protein